MHELLTAEVSKRSHRCFRAVGLNERLSAGQRGRCEVGVVSKVRALRGKQYWLLTGVKIRVLDACVSPGISG